MSKNQIKVNIFPLFGPLIATSIILLIFNVSFFIANPTVLTTDLISASYLSEAMGMSLFAVIIGYMVGIIPGFITEQLFKKILRRYSIPHAYHHFLKAGFFASLIWIIPCLLLGLFTEKLMTGVILLFICIVTSIICAHISWNRYKVPK